jgi:hypothetical protein
MKCGGRLPVGVVQDGPGECPDGLRCAAPLDAATSQPLTPGGDQCSAPTCHRVKWRPRKGRSEGMCHRDVIRLGALFSLRYTCTNGSETVPLCRNKALPSGVSERYSPAGQLGPSLPMLVTIRRSMPWKARAAWSQVWSASGLTPFTRGRPVRASAGRSSSCAGRPAPRLADQNICSLEAPWDRPLSSKPNRRFPQPRPPRSPDKER